MFQIHKSLEKKGQILRIISGYKTTKSDICLSKGRSLKQLFVNGEESFKTFELFTTLHNKP
jgi:hypothetical protein